MTESLVGGDKLALVTVAMPVYNAGKYLRLAVLSIVSQVYPNWELLIIDDGSTDNALSDIADIKDKRIRVFQDGRNRGLAARLNEAADMAQGQYFARMDQDDVSYPERFARQVAELEKDLKLDLVATRAITIDENDQATGFFPFANSHIEICARPWRGFYFPHPTWMGRIEWFRKYRYTVPGPFFCEDQELLLRSYRFSRFGAVNEILFAYRIRRSINLRKLMRTQLTFFVLQLRYFADLKLWFFMFLATAAYVGKIIGDLSKTMRIKILKPRNDVLNNAVIVEWNKVFDNLTTEHKKTCQ